MFLFGGAQIHRLNNLLDEKCSTIQIGSNQFKFAKMQIPFLSNKAFQHFEETTQPFIIDQFQSSGITLSDLVSCFRQLESLIKNEVEIKNDEKNVSLFLQSYLIIHCFWSAVIKFLRQILNFFDEVQSIFLRFPKTKENHSKIIRLSSMDLPLNAIFYYFVAFQINF
jgi:hypothetical protein